MAFTVGNQHSRRRKIRGGGRPTKDISQARAEAQERLVCKFAAALDKVLEAMIREAKKGDVSAAKLVIDKLMPEDPGIAGEIGLTIVLSQDLRRKLPKASK